MSPRSCRCRRNGSLAAYRRPRRSHGERATSWRMRPACRGSRRNDFGAPAQARRTGRRRPSGSSGSGRSARAPAALSAHNEARRTGSRRLGCRSWNHSSWLTFQNCGRSRTRWPYSSHTGILNSCWVIICNPSTTPSAQGCHPCLRYVPLPMSPVRTADSPLEGGGIRTLGPPPPVGLGSEFRGCRRKAPRFAILVCLTRRAEKAGLGPSRKGP